MFSKQNQSAQFQKSMFVPGNESKSQTKSIFRPVSVSFPRLPELKMGVCLGKSAEKVAGNLVVVFVAGLPDPSVWLSQRHSCEPQTPISQNVLFCR